MLIIVNIKSNCSFSSKATLFYSLLKVVLPFYLTPILMSSHSSSKTFNNFSWAFNQCSRQLLQYPIVGLTNFSLPRQDLFKFFNPLPTN